MRPQGFREHQLVEQSAILLLAETDWRTVSALKEVCGVDCTLGRETKSEVVLLPRLLTALDPLNPDFPPEAISAARDERSRELLASLFFEQGLLAN